MSTKIYTAYKLKDGVDLWKFLESVKPTVIENIRKILYDLAMSYITGPCMIKQAQDQNKDLITPMEAYDWIYQQYNKQSSSMVRNEFDFDVSLNVYKDGQSYYFIPYSDMLVRKVWDFLKKHEGVVDFAYWNNTDQPENVSNKEWELRSTVWDRIFDGFDPINLRFIINDPQSFYKVFDCEGLRKVWKEYREKNVKPKS